MTLGEKQRIFSKAISHLILYAYSQGYEITVGDFFRDPRVHGEFGKSGDAPYGRSRSCHKLKLAADLNLFKDGKYLNKTSDHEFLGKRWEAMCERFGVEGVWGGKFNDGNHYSIKHWGAA